MMNDVVRSFEGEYAFLSNFYPAPIEWQGLLFPTVEHAFQAAKCSDPAEWPFFTHGVAADIKQHGQTVTLRPDWEEVKQDLMLDLTRRKFEIPALARRLLATGTAELIEGNLWGDRYWGVCGGVGRNELGKILMRVRDEMRRCPPFFKSKGGLEHRSRRVRAAARPGSLTQK